jgi:hypothetical protein
MGRTVIAVFSGTGNARRAAGIVAAELEAAERHTELVDLAAGARTGASACIDANIPELGAGSDALRLRRRDAQGQDLGRLERRGIRRGTGSPQAQGLGAGWFRRRELPAELDPDVRGSHGR